MHTKTFALTIGAALRAPPATMEFGENPTARKTEWIPGGYAPTYLDGSLPGDRGMDPLALVALARTGTKAETTSWAKLDRKTQMLMMSKYEAKRKLLYMREAEIKHSRLAMLTAVLWPLSELITGQKGFTVPFPLLVVATLGISALELKTLDNAEGLTPTGYTAGDVGFDPAGFGKMRDDMPLAEIKHGRLAMMAVTGYFVQELFYGVPLFKQYPFA